MAPERKYWVVMRRLAEIPVADTGDCSRIHICGEAYSDYHGFMEGSLRSAAYVLHRMLDKEPKHTFEGWLNGDLSGLRVKDSYLTALRNWAEKLDEIKSTDSYL